MARGNEGRPGIPARKPADWKPHEEYIKMAISMDTNTAERLNSFCEVEERAKSWVIRKALDEWLKARGF